MIRQTLDQTKAATFCVMLPDAERHGMPFPTGTGFMVSADGLFVTAAHVITDENGQVRGNVEEAFLQGAPRTPSEPPIRLIQHPRAEFVDKAADIAILKCDFNANREKDWLRGRRDFPFLTVSAESLAEGQPVYSYGFPLSKGRIESAEPGFTVASTSLSPRVTSAVVASLVEYHGMVQASTDPQVYVLDKALNYGNSGGPIIATETGHVHAVCTRFQPLHVPQPGLRDAEQRPVVIMVPALYGVVSRLSDPRVLGALQARGVPLHTDVAGPDRSS
jgi:serine protease Do